MHARRAGPVMTTEIRVLTDPFLRIINASEAEGKHKEVCTSCLGLVERALIHILLHKLGWLTYHSLNS